MGRSHASALVETRSDLPKTSSLPGFAERLLLALPGLAHHACDNDERACLSVELADTELAHVFEHVTLEVMRLAGSPAMSGETRWDFRRDGRGRYRVRIGFDDDLVCLGAMRTAERILEAVASGAPLPPFAGEVERLRSLRRARHDVDLAEERC